MNTVDNETVPNKSVVYNRSRLCKRLSVSEYKMVLFFLIQLLSMLSLT